MTICAQSLQVREVQIEGIISSMSSGQEMMLMFHVLARQQETPVEKQLVHALNLVTGSVCSPMQRGERGNVCISGSEEVYRLVMSHVGESTPVPKYNPCLPGSERLPPELIQTGNGGHCPTVQSLLFGSHRSLPELIHTLNGGEAEVPLAPPAPVFSCSQSNWR